MCAYTSTQHKNILFFALVLQVVHHRVTIIAVHHQVGIKGIIMQCSWFAAKNQFFFKHLPCNTVSCHSRSVLVSRPHPRITSERRSWITTSPDCRIVILGWNKFDESTNFYLRFHDCIQLQTVTTHMQLQMPTLHIKFLMRVYYTYLYV